MNAPTVLVCDDEPVIGAVLRRSFDAHGVEVLIDTCSDPVHLAQHFNPKAIFLDLLQPRDGLTLLQELKADPVTRDIPVIVMSAAFAGDERPEALCPGAMALGAVAVVAKPVPLPLIASLAELVKGHRGSFELPRSAVEPDFEIDVVVDDVECDLEVVTDELVSC